MNIREIADRIEELVLKEFNKRDNRKTDKLSIIGDDYHNRLLIAQRLELLKLIIFPYYKTCKYCGKELERDKLAFRGDEIVHCTKSEECSDKWSLDFFGEKGKEFFDKLDNAVSCGISNKGMHVTYKDGKEEWI